MADCGKRDLMIIDCQTQKDMKRLAGARSVCLDAYGTDSAGKKYDPKQGWELVNRFPAFAVSFFEHSVKSMKKSLITSNRQSGEVDTDFLRRAAGSIRYCRAAGGHSL